MYTPRVTVIVATYNRSNLLPYSIGSVLKQTYRDFEVLVVGDGCTDDSEQVARATGDPRVRWINLPSNTGHQSGPNNRGLKEARGELVAYLGHDDLWLPHHLECMVAEIDAEGVDFAYSIVGQVAPGAAIASPTWPVPAAASYSPPTGTMHQRAVTDAIGGWTDYRELTIPPDAELWGRAHRAGFRFGFVRRLTALKFSAAARRNVYRERPCGEQAHWFQRICDDPHFEASQLAAMLMEGAGARAMPGRMLFPIALSELATRARARVAHVLGTMLTRKGADITAAKRYKGL